MDNGLLLGMAVGGLVGAALATCKTAPKDVVEKGKKALKKCMNAAE